MNRRRHLSFEGALAEAASFPSTYGFTDMIHETGHVSSWISDVFDGSELAKRYHALHAEAFSLLHAHGRAELAGEFERAELEHEAVHMNAAFRLGLALGQLRAAESVERTRELLELEARIELPLEWNDR